MNCQTKSHKCFFLGITAAIITMLALAMLYAPSTSADYLGGNPYNIVQ